MSERSTVSTPMPRASALERFAGHKSRMDSQDSSISAHTGRLSGLDTTTAGHRSRLDDHDTTFAGHSTRINAAQSDAGTALTRGSLGITKADAAQTTANGAQSDATTALTRGSLGITKADAAQTTADGAQAAVLGRLSRTANELNIDGIKRFTGGLEVFWNNNFRITALDANGFVRGVAL